MGENKKYTKNERKNTVMYKINKVQNDKQIQKQQRRNPPQFFS